MAAASSIPSPAAPRRVLIVLLGSIGDVVRALPLLGRMRRAWPTAHLVWAVEPKSEPILRAHPWLDAVIVYERRRAPLSFFSFLRTIRNNNFDLVIDLQRHLKSGVIGRVSGAPRRVGFASTNTKEYNHLFSTQRIAPQPKLKLKLAQYQAFGDALAIPGSAIEFGLRLSTEESAKALGLIAAAPRPRVAVILGSSWPSRVYPPDAIAAVIRELSQPFEDSPGFFPILIGGPDEGELGAAVVAELKGKPGLSLVGKTNLRDLIGIFAECAVAFGPDSGPMHIAAAVGCPIVSLWGATAPERSAPWGFADFALRGDIPCHPCYLRRCPIGGECMRRIDPKTVAQAVRRAALVPGKTEFAAGPSAERR